MINERRVRLPRLFVWEQCIEVMLLDGRGGVDAGG